MAIAEAAELAGLAGERRPILLVLFFVSVFVKLPGLVEAEEESWSLTVNPTV